MVDRDQEQAAADIQWRLLGTLPREVLRHLVWKYESGGPALHFDLDELASTFGVSRKAIQRVLKDLRRGGFLSSSTFVEMFLTQQSYLLERLKDSPPVDDGPLRRSKVTIPPELRWQIWERDDFRCRICGVRSNLSVDHIHPESLGGTLDPDNLQTLCKSCNSRKGVRVQRD